MNIKLDVVDEQILLALREGPRGLQSLATLSNINYNTLRQRIDKLIRYSYIAKPGYGEYALTDKGRNFVDELSSPVAPDFDDPNLKKLIAMLPSELHRSFFRLVISGIIAKYLLFEVYDDGYPGFILGGRTKGFKTASGKVICRIFGLIPERNIYPLYIATPGEVGVRRFRSKETVGFDTSASSFFDEPFMVFDEYDKVSDKNIKRNVLFFLDGRSKFNVEETTIQNHACCMVTLNTNLHKENLDRFEIPEPYIRRCVVADTEYVQTELRNVDLVAKEIFELKDFPRINLKRLQMKKTTLTDEEFNSLRNLFLACVNDEFQPLVDTMPLVILTLGRSPLLADDLQESVYQTIWDRLICLESLGGCVPGWRELVGKEWNSYKQTKQPGIKKQLVQAVAKEQSRKSLIEERKDKIHQKTAEQMNTKYELIYQRQLLVKEIKDHIPRLQHKHPEFAKTLATLWREVNSKAVTEETLNIYRLTFNNIINQKVLPAFEEEEKLRKLEDEKREQLAEIDALISKVNTLNQKYKEFSMNEVKLENWLATLSEDRNKVEGGNHPARLLSVRIAIIFEMPTLEQKLEEINKKKEEAEKQRDIELSKLKSRIKDIDYYLGRKRFDAASKEDPILILQKLGILTSLRFDPGPTEGHWELNQLSGKSEYQPPTGAFLDMDIKVHNYSEIKMWLSWQDIYPLLRIAHEKLKGEFKRLKDPPLFVNCLDTRIANDLL